MADNTGITAEALPYAKAGERDDQPPQVLIQIDVEFVLRESFSIFKPRVETAVQVVASSGLDSSCRRHVLSRAVGGHVASPQRLICN